MGDDMGISLANVDVGGLFSGLGTLAKDIRTAITGVDPDKAALIEQKLLEIEAAGQQGQMAINAAEAATGKAGWRNGLGWVCVAGFAYQFLAYPLLAWLCLNMKWVSPPPLDASIMVNLLGAMLGLGTMKVIDLKNGTRT
jgi:hypothetical protein